MSKTKRAEIEAMAERAHAVLRAQSEARTAAYKCAHEALAALYADGNIPSDAELAAVEAELSAKLSHIGESV